MKDPHQLTIFLLAISIMLFMARLLGELFNKIRQPAIIGEILGGIILGPTVFGNISPDLQAFLFPVTGGISHAFEGMTSLAVVMLLIISGLEINLNLVLKQKKPAFYTSTLGMIIPFIIGFSTSYFIPSVFGITEDKHRLVFSLFMGTAMSISALPVIARTLMDMKLIRTEIGVIIIASAIVNDLFGWGIFSVILGMMGSEKDGGLGFLKQIGITLFFLAFMFLVVRNIIERLLSAIQEKLSFPGATLSFIFILGFLCAALTEWVGIHAIFGAFIAGVAIGDTPVLKEKTRDVINQFVTNIFAPLFFISIGLKVNFIANFDLFSVVIILIIAYIGKVLGSGLGAKLGGFSAADSAVIGFGMNSRGAMEIILGLLALEAGLINEKIFVALVIMALITSVGSAPFMSYFLKFSRKKKKFAWLLEPAQVYYTDFTAKDEILRFLTARAAPVLSQSETDVYNAVMQREQLIPTGIANGLAIPHAKMNVQKPVALLAVNKSEIDFEAADGKRCSIIVLLITPEKDPEIQLNLLSDIVKNFRTTQDTEELKALSSGHSVVNFLRKKAES
ncbi:MAG: cation:proton antiporter [Ignavibacteriaceae bacterium]|nr:cation:proton antiporter [Ignavibacteriaceae bacterium]